MTPFEPIVHLAQFAQLVQLTLIGLLALWITSSPVRAAWAEVRNLHDRPTLFVDGQPAPPFAYMSYLGREPYYRGAAGVGIHLYCFPAYLGDRGINTSSGIGPFRPAIWKGEHDFDFGSLRADFEMLLRACLRWLSQSPYANHLVGIHVADGGTEEWVYHYHEAYHDENPTRVAVFREWLRATYDGDTQKLRAAWADPAADFATARPLFHCRSLRWLGPAANINRHGIHNVNPRPMPQHGSMGR